MKLIDVFLSVYRTPDAEEPFPCEPPEGVVLEALVNLIDLGAFTGGDSLGNQYVNPQIVQEGGQWVLLVGVLGVYKTIRIERYGLRERERARLLPVVGGRKVAFRPQVQCLSNLRDIQAEACAFMEEHKPLFLSISDAHRCRRYRETLRLLGSAGQWGDPLLGLKRFLVIASASFIQSSKEDYFDMFIYFANLIKDWRIVDSENWPISWAVVLGWFIWFSQTWVTTARWGTRELVK